MLLLLLPDRPAVDTTEPLRAACHSGLLAVQRPRPASHAHSPDPSGERTALIRPLVGEEGGLLHLSKNPTPTSAIEAHLPPTQNTPKNNS